MKGDIIAIVGLLAPMALLGAWLGVAWLIRRRASS